MKEVWDAGRTFATEKWKWANGKVIAHGVAGGAWIAIAGVPAGVSVYIWQQAAGKS